MAQTVRVGVGCFLFRSDWSFVTGVRKGSHGAGALQLPGGHLEVGESPEACAVREVEEETGLRTMESDVKFLTATNDIFEAESKHYVTLFVGCRVPDDVEPEVLEPEKCERWEWTSWEKLKALAADPDNTLFLPLRDLFLQRPDLDPRMAFRGNGGGGRGRANPSRSAAMNKRASYFETQEDAEEDIEVDEGDTTLVNEEDEEEEDDPAR
ncbi:hypothetical protein JCM8547_004588 [Rhodosporidiobolus lusitaniae]